MSPRRLLIRETLLLSATVALASQLIALSQEKDPKLQAMQQRLADVKAGFADKHDSSPNLQRNPTPLLRFSDPTRQGFDGTLWLWTSRSRPVALLSLTRYPDFWNYEHISLTERPLEFTGRENWKWSSQGKPRKWIKVDDPVAKDSKRRLIQMRHVSRQFQAIEHFEDQQHNLRLLPRPVYLYSDPDATVLDGGLFIFSHATNPEIAMTVESRRADSGETAWFVAFTRTGAAELTVHRGGDEIWKAPKVLQWNPREPYYSHQVPIPDAATGK